MALLIARQSMILQSKSYSSSPSSSPRTSSIPESPAGELITATLMSGQDFKDLMQDMLDGCQDGDEGVVNGCASVGAGNAAMFGN